MPSTRRNSRPTHVATNNNSKLKLWLIIGAALLVTAIIVAIVMSSINKHKEDNFHSQNGLPAPQNVRVVGNTVMWDIVPNAKSYRVYLGDEHSFLGTSYSNEFIVNDLFPSDYKISVVAVDTDDISSELMSKSVDVDYSTYEGVTLNLAAPQPKMRGDNVLEWESIPNAEGYGISVNGEEIAQVKETTFDLNELYDGIHQVKVRAISDVEVFNDSFWSGPEFFLQEHNPLRAPVLKKYAREVSWSPVKGATRYEVSINGNITQKTAVSFDTSSLPDASYTIKTRAINGPSVGEWSDPIDLIVGSGQGGGDTGGGNQGGGGDTGGGNQGGGGDTGGGNQGGGDTGGGEQPGIVGNLISPSIIYLHQRIQWGAINGATSYDVKINEVITNQTGLFFLGKDLGKEPGVRVCFVRSRNGNEVSEWSNVVRPTVGLAVPTAVINGATLSWGAVTGATGYEVCIDGKMFNEQKTTEYSIAGLGNGVHSIGVRAHMSGHPNLYSSFSKSIGLSIGQSDSNLATPFIGLVEDWPLEGGGGRVRAIFWNPVAGATGYDISVDDNQVVSGTNYTQYFTDWSSGKHTVKVRAVSGSSTGSWSNAITFDPDVEMDSDTINGTPTENNLPTPSLGFGGWTAMWQPVSGATAYHFMINGTDYIQTETSLTFPSSVSGLVQARVRALNNVDKLSQWSNVLIASF
ncbi:MAG: hypothetical protein FWF58_01850 [Firmicutes bacterium]|nr:hypothetical protein [Bacillota bacterium]